MREGAWQLVWGRLAGKMHHLILYERLKGVLGSAVLRIPVCTKGKDSGGAGFCWCLCGLQAYGGLWGCCGQGDGCCDKVAPELSGTSLTEFQVALPYSCKHMSRQGLITVIFIIVSWSMACSLPSDDDIEEARTGAWLERALHLHKHTIPRYTSFTIEVNPPTKI